MECFHQWQKVYEQFLLGGAFPIGYRCKSCGEYVTIDKVPVTGLGGKDTGEQVLHGPHGCKGTCSDGSVFKKQTAYADGRLEIER